MQRTSGVVPYEHGTQPDGQRPNDKTFGGGEDAFNTLLRNWCRGACSTRGSSSILSHGCGWSTYWHVLAPPHPEQPISRKEDAADISHAVPMQSGKPLALSWTAPGNWWTTALAFKVSWSTIGAGKAPGSGLRGMFLKCLSVNYGNKSLLGFTVWTRPQLAMVVVEPYNILVCVPSLLELTDLVVVLDTRLCTTFAAVIWTSSVQHYTLLYRLLAQVISRSGGALNVVDVAVFQTDCVPCPRMHFTPWSHFGPASTKGKIATLATVSTRFAVSCTAAMLCTRMSSTTGRS